MNITPVIFFDLIAAIFILAIALIIVIVYLSKITKTLHENLNLRDEALKKNSDLLDEARNKAVKIIDDANNKALDIISKVNLLADTTAEKFKEDLSRSSSAQIKEFEKLTSDFTRTYSQILEDLKMKNVEVFQNISKDIETNTMTEVENFRESMQKLTTLSQKKVAEKIDSDYEKAKKELEDYKKEELDKINSNIYKFLEKMSKLILGKALSLSDQEDLIEKALEKAKKEGVFKS